jgi:thioesterase domain-containing protein
MPLSNPSLVLLQEGNAHAPLFLIHPQGGGVICYRHLAQALGKERTVYGLQIPDYAAHVAPLTSIVDMAAYYLKQIQQVAPHGPYYLAGWSFGGMVAFEIARDLEAAGEEIAMLGLLDSNLPDQTGQGQREPQAAALTLVDVATDLLEMERSVFAGLDEEASLALALHQAKELELLPQHANVDLLRQQIRIMSRNQDAVDAYRCTGSIHSAIHFFRASQVSSTSPRALVDPQIWRKYTTGDLYIIPLPAHHHNLVNPPHVFALAKAIQAIYAEAEQQEVLAVATRQPEHAVRSTER